jgi:hypothetical protein
MTGEKKILSSYEKNEDPQRDITFGDGNQSLVKGLGKISISPDHFISNVFLVDSLDYNLLSVSQLCKMGYNCLFADICVTVFRRSDDSIYVLHDRTLCFLYACVQGSKQILRKFTLGP